jgi:1,4-dihydroxy-6-naphthoate synthase
MPETLTLAHSPDPDDAYMYYGFHTGDVQIPGYKIQQHIEEIQRLNERAFRGEFEITAVSSYAFACVSDKYWLLSSGASVGRNYGPMLVGKSARPKAQGRLIEPGPANLPLRIAVPGKWTTATLVFYLWLSKKPMGDVEIIFVPFDQIIDQVKSGKVDLGLLIHEGQLTYAYSGLEKVWDAGEWWHQETGLPLPLGLDIVRKDLGRPLAQKISQAMRDSIQFANAHREKAIAYALQFGRGLDNALADRFVGMYVNEDTLKQGKDVLKGLRTLYERAFAEKLIPGIPDLTMV